METGGVARGLSVRAWFDSIDRTSAADIEEQPMALHHSEETHRNLLQRVPTATGKELPEWFRAIENGPAFLRFDDRVNWLRDEHGISHGHASAIVHEHDLHRASRSFD